MPLVVAGGGAAGFMAAITAAEAGVPIEPLVSGTSDSTRFVFLDMCHDVVEAPSDIVDAGGETDSEPEEIVVDVELPLDASLSETVDSAENLFFAASVEPGQFS